MIYSIFVHRKDSVRELTNTLPDFIQYFGYTLECGKAYEHEKGNKKINLNPKTIVSLVTNVNNALTNSNKNGMPETYYTLKS